LGTYRKWGVGGDRSEEVRTKLEGREKAGKKAKTFQKYRLY